MQAFEVSNESSFYYYDYNGQLTLALNLVFTLDHDIDRTAMQAALTRAARTYPQFSSRLAYVDGRFWYVENDEPVVLYENDDQTCALGSADTNHYLYRVWAEGTTLGIVANHGLADGHYLMSFATTLLFYYAVERGLVAEDAELEGIVKEGDIAVPTFDPYLREANTEVPPIGTPDIGPIFSLPVEYGEDKGDFSCYVDVIRVSASQLVELAKRSGSRVSPLVMAIQARAMGKAWDTEGKALIGPITNDLRASFDSGNVGNFSSWVLGVFPAQLAQADFATQCAALQQAMETQLAPEALRVQMGRSVAQTAAERGKSLDELFNSLERHRQTICYTRAYLGLYVSNVGALHLPEPLGQMVCAVECILPSFSSPFNFTMAGVGDEIRMCLTRTFADDAFSRAMVDELQALGVEASLEEREARPFPTMGRDAVLELDEI